MFKSLPKPVFFKIINKFDTKELHRLLLVSKYFYQLIDSEEFWTYRITILKMKLLKHYKKLDQLDATLTAAAMLGRTEYVQRYIDDGANVNAKLFYYEDQNAYINPIHYAALSGNLSCVKLLIHNKATFLPEDPNMDSDTPLHFAVRKGNYECAQFFLDNGVPVDHATRFSFLGWNWTALQVASSADQPRCCELLIKRGANVHHKDPDEFQAIHRAAQSGSVECIKVLVKHMADVNAYNEDGKSPLGGAVLNGHPDCVRVLLECGANPRHGDWLSRFNLPLQKAIIDRQFDIAKVLLEYDPTLIDAVYMEDGEKYPMGDKTALQIAAIRGDVESITFLLSYDPDPDYVCYKSKTALAYAQENGHGQCVELLSDYIIEREFTMSAIRL